MMPAEYFEDPNVEIELVPCSLPPFVLLASTKGYNRYSREWTDKNSNET
jgi:hypothetical protein